MLARLQIKNLALITELALEFDAGLNMVTGETGAGKSVIIGALQLLLGQRADHGLVRSGAARGEAHAVLELGASTPLAASVDALLQDCGLPACDQGQLLLGRVLTEKTVRNFVNGAPATAQVLKQLGDLLVDVHGPYDHQSLLRPAPQLAVLDSGAGLDAARTQYRERYHQWQEQLARLAATQAEVPAPDALEVLQVQLREIQAARLQPGEDEELTSRHRVAAHAQQILATLTQCQAQLSEGEGACLEAARNIRRELFAIARLDPAGGERLGQAMERAISELQALADDLASYADQLDLDPKAFAQMEQRLGVLSRLKRKYGGSLEAVQTYAAQTEARLQRLGNHEAQLQEQRRLAEQLEAAARAAAADLRERRRAAAGALGTKAAAKLRLLGFAEARFAVQLTAAPLGPSGADAVEFLFCPNPGEPLRPLREIASSGEIARVMLALKTVLAEADQVPVLIFDEVDANIGGRVATRVGAELRALSRGRQVICITHLPQVAAGGDRHFRVDKQVVEGRTLTTVAALDRPGRVAELVRMLGGEEGAKAARRHAEALLAEAQTP